MTAAMPVFLSNDLYDQAKYGYFASPLFHARLRKMNAEHEAWPSNRAGRRLVEKKLGCKFSDFMAFLESIAGDDGFAHVPIGGDECISIEIGPRRLPEGVTYTPLSEEVSQAVRGYSEALGKMGDDERARYHELADTGRKAEALATLEAHGLKPLLAGFVLEGAPPLLAKILDAVTPDPVKH